MGFFDKITGGNKKEEEPTCGSAGFVHGALKNMRGGEAPSKEEVNRILDEAKRKK